MTDKEILRWCFQYLESKDCLKLDKSTRDDLLQQINTPGLTLAEEMRLQCRLVSVEASIGINMAKMLGIEEMFRNDPNILTQILQHNETDKQ